MKKFTIPCTFNNEKSPVTIYIGEPNPNVHPLKHQAAWLQERGGQIPSEVMESFETLHSRPLA